MASPPNTFLSAADKKDLDKVGFLFSVIYTFKGRTPVYLFLNVGKAKSIILGILHEAVLGTDAK
jgi:hypothetical protein